MLLRGLAGGTSMRSLSGVTDRGERRSRALILVYLLRFSVRNTAS
jgi:hypothetical protein